MTDDLLAIEEELQGYPGNLVEDFRRSADALRLTLSGEQLHIWATESLELAKHSLRSWEATGEFLRASPTVLSRVSFPAFRTWVLRGRELAGARRAQGQGPRLGQQMREEGRRTQQLDALAPELVGHGLEDGVRAPVLEPGQEPDGAQVGENAAEEGGVLDLARHDGVAVCLTRGPQQNDRQVGIEGSDPIDQVPARRI